MTQQFAAPTVGKTVKVTTRYRNIYYFSDAEYDYHTYTGQVGRPDGRVPQGSFMLLCDDVNMPVRVIALRNVTELKYADGKSVGRVAVEPRVRTWQVSSSRPGKFYTVTEIAGHRTCDCPGFQFRKNCRHTKEVK